MATDSESRRCEGEVRWKQGASRACLGSFAACDAHGLSFVQGAPVHLCLESIDESSLRRFGLEPSGIELAHVQVIAPHWPEGVFRALVAVTRSDGTVVPTSDVLQAWLDVSKHPARGRARAGDKLADFCNLLHPRWAPRDTCSRRARRQCRRVGSFVTQPAPAPDDRDLEALSAQLRALARQLVRDPSSADDLVQEAWLAALDQRRGAVRELGAWLRTVVRNLAARSARREALRQLAHERSAEAESSRETEEALERANIALALRDAAHELAEPVRSVIVLHYFEGRTLEATAALLGRPLETVRSQRRRGIEELRGVLDRRHRGARRDWLAALAPLLGARPAPAPRWRWAALAALTSIAVVSLGVWFARSAPAPAPALASAAPGTDEAGESRVEGGEASARTDVAPPAPASAPPPPIEPLAAPEIATKRFAARVTDPDGAPVAGARLDALGLDGLQLGPFTTGGDGRVAFEVRVDQLSYRASFAERGGIVVHALAPGRAKAPLAIVPSIDGEQEFELQIGGPGQALAGVVLDPDGAPVVGAQIELDIEVKHVTRTPTGVLLMEELRRAVSGPDGRFLLENLPRRSHRWVARARDLGVASGALEGDAEKLEMTIALPRGVEIAGVVRGSNGAPAVDAEVWVARGVSFNLLAPRARTDERGRYRLRGIMDSPIRIFVRAGGDVDESADALHAFANDAERSELDFVLSPRPPIDVRCLEADGRPSPAGMVVLETEPGAPAPWRQSASTDADGRARWADYPLGPLMAQFVPTSAPGAVLRRDFDSRVTTTLELRLGESERASTSAVSVALVDPWHAPLQAHIVAISSADGSKLQADVDPRTGVLEAFELPPGERQFFAVDAFGVTALGAAKLDGAATVDLGLHTLGSVRSIDLDWSLEGASELTWLLVGQLSASCGYERLCEFAPGRTRFELRDGNYQLVGRSPTGDERVSIDFTVGDGLPVRVQVQ
jgi:RNA polymerase sigma-70 factor (ECF subfamily)